MKSAFQFRTFHRFALATLAGILQALAFPNVGFSWLAWFAPGLILFAAFGLPGKRAVQIGFCGGLAFHLVSLYWLLLIPFPFHAFLSWLGICLILGSLTALWTWFCWKTLPMKSLQLNRCKWHQRILWILLCSAGWVTVEMITARLFTGFPWNLLGISQFKNYPVIQIASLTGIYGVSFVMVWVSVSLVFPLISIRRGEHNYRNWSPEIAVSIVLLFGVMAFGHKQISKVTDHSRKITIALIQPSIPQSVIWDAAERTNRFNKLVALSQRAAGLRPDLLVWPEAALPNMLTRFNETTLNTITNLVIANRMWMIIGANDSRMVREPGSADRTDFFNSAFLINPKGDLVGRYHKRHLVPFGEYMPAARWFPFLGRFRSLNSGFVGGEHPVSFDLSELGVKTSPLICFEDVFAHLAREHVQTDTDFLLNLTNDGWFGKSSAQWQHAAGAVFRAVENGVPLVRCANNGLTCWIDAHGKLTYFSEANDIYAAGFQLVEIPLRKKTAGGSATFYNQHGDWFGWSCVGLTVATFPFIIRRKKST